MKHTFTFLFKDLGYFIAFWALVLIEVGVVASGWYSGWDGWMALCAVIPACALVGMTLGAELHRRSLREALVYQAFKQVLHNRDQYGLPEKTKDMDTVKVLELDLSRIAIPPARATFWWTGKKIEMKAEPKP